MKNLKVVIAAITLTFFTTTAFAVTETTAKNTLRSEMVSLLGDKTSIELDFQSYEYCW